MLSRRLKSDIDALLAETPAVALLGPRQVGKTTLALSIAANRPSVYLDLQDPVERERLAEPGTYLDQNMDRLVVLDEVQNVPELFARLRGSIDRGRRTGREAGRFLLLGSATGELLRQSSESLAGRIAYRELSPLDLLEVGFASRDALWVRGGMPRSFLARTEAASVRWRGDLVRTYLSRDIAGLDVRTSEETMRRLWTMLAHAHGTPLNASRLATALGLSSPTVGRYIDLLVDLFLVRRLQPFHANLGKRLVKSPKLYVRDSGILHALLTIRSMDQLEMHPAVGASWEGFVIETLIACAPEWTQAYFFRTQAGAEIDLLLELPGGSLWAVEIKRNVAPRIERGFHLACDDLRPARRLLVYGGDAAVPLPHGIEAMSLGQLAGELLAMRQA